MDNIDIKSNPIYFQEKCLEKRNNKLINLIFFGGIKFDILNNEIFPKNGYDIFYTNQLMLYHEKFLTYFPYLDKILKNKWKYFKFKKLYDNYFNNNQICY